MPTLHAHVTLMVAAGFTCAVHRRTAIVGILRTQLMRDLVAIAKFFYPYTQNHLTLWRLAPFHIVRTVGTHMLCRLR